MRVAEFYDILDRNLQQLDMLFTEDVRIHDGRVGYKYSGMLLVIAAIHELSTVPGIEAECANIRRTTFLQNGNDSGVATQEDWRLFKGCLNELKSVATRVRDVLGSMIPETSPNSIAIKLPNVTDLASLRSLIGDIQISLERPVQMVLNEQITVQGVDRGSVWLILVGSVTLVVRFVFGILYAANQYMRQQAELERYMQHTRSLESRDEHTATIEAINTKLMEDLGKSLAQQLLDGRSVDPEIVSTTLNAIKTLASLRKQGLDMQLAANAPAELKLAYKDFILPVMDMGELKPQIPLQLTAGATDGRKIVEDDVKV